MTVSATVGTEFSVGTLVTMGHKLAGLINVGQTLNAAQATFGRQLLETILDSVQSEGLSAKATGFELVTLTAGTYKYSLSAGVLDLVGTAMYIAASEADVEQASGETPVSLASVEQWQMTSSKSARGRPCIYYPYRALSTIQAWVWPVPDEAGRIRFQTHRKLSDVQDDNATIDMEPYWSQFAIWELAHQLGAAASLPTGRIAYFAGQAMMRKNYAKSMALGHAQGQMEVDHMTRWARR
jgi:hypothetical protein